MRNKEELLKIYSAYLPYQLNIAVMGEFVDEDRKIPQIFEMVGLDTNYVEYHELGRTITEQIEFTDVFPHLWSMDMLTKEIEHKGERFIPIQELRRHCIEDLGAKDYDTDIGLDTLLKGWEVIYYPKLFIDKLLEWHFNVFGLDKSEYVQKKSTIQK